MKRAVLSTCATLAARATLAAVAASAAFIGGIAAAAERPIVVASKNFTESYILGEALAQLLQREGFRVERKLGLGGTKICYDALVAGDIDVYVEYTGTIAEAIKDVGSTDRQVLGAALASDGVEMLPTLGFNNTYALAVSAPVAAARGMTRISDLAQQPRLRIALSHELLERRDGWPGLRAVYGFDWTPEGIEHALAYQAIADGAIDATDAYSTDGELNRYALVVLEDDRGFFPAYHAVPLVRSDLEGRAKAAIRQTANTLGDAEMRALNASVLLGEETTASAASRYVATKIARSSNGASTAEATRSAAARAWWQRLAANTLRHLQLVALAVLPAVLVAVLLALAFFRVPWLAKTAVYVAGLLQTVPSIALLALLIPLAGIGVVPAVVALFLYALLPILRNATTALGGIDPTLKRVAVAMGLTPREELRYVLVPLAMPSIVAGVRTAAVIGIGTATLAAFIGAGGLGDPIVKGLALNDTRLILEGAVPAALLAIATELLFEQLERWLSPGHLRASA